VEATCRRSGRSETERKRRLVARRYQVVRHRTRLKNEVHSILHAHLSPK
jgi:transposase